ncbi:hypothetical protein EDC19_0382 [Natranaerovirga hydrolytica]|uniref:SnoaL-like protein n=1 Tax=Natranaerovirga hydrolytica TaxID=680378 RepID=A0A4R1MXP2_9FIRM|nr:hypothetical protein [Natranaerovirga hydrolytica]TCK97976.1 hypothetical protein EDC19_0382 [Natranaerovirga hydrolytica]
MTHIKNIAIIVLVMTIIGLLMINHTTNQRLKQPNDTENNPMNQEEYMDDIIEIFNLSSDFILAHTQGDARALKEMLPSNFTVEKNEDKVNILYEYANETIKQTVYGNREADFKSFKINGINWKDDQNVMIHFQEIYIDTKTEAIFSPPTFLNLEFKKVGGEWRIGAIEFDI